MNRRMSRMAAIIIFDILVLTATDLVLLVLYRTHFNYLGWSGVAVQYLLSVSAIMCCRGMLGVYRQVWHYADAPAYIRLILADMIALLIYYVIQTILPFPRLSLMRALSLFAGELLICITRRRAGEAGGPSGCARL